MTPATATNLDDSLYNAELGLYYLRIDGFYYRRLYRANWELITQEHIKRLIWSQLNEKRCRVFKQQLIEQRLISQ